MPKPTRRAHKERSPRILANEGPRATFVTFSSKPAQLLDVSLTGARLLSRRPSQLKVGDVVNIDFALDGSETRINSTARVVRREGDFDFAVRFVEMKMSTREKLVTALARLVTFKSAPTESELSRTVKQWAYTHRRGLLLAFFGLVLAGLVGGSIFLSSDEYLGKELRAWGNGAPKQWYWDYVKHFN